MTGLKTAENDVGGKKSLMFCKILPVVAPVVLKMAQTTSDALFGPVFVNATFQKVYST